MLVQIGVAASFWQVGWRAARVGEDRDFPFMLQDELRWPAESFKVEMHCQEPGLNGCQRGPASAARISHEQASGGLGDLIDHRIFRDPPQKPKPLQIPEPGTRTWVPDRPISSSAWSAVQYPPKGTSKRRNPWEISSREMERLRKDTMIEPPFRLISVWDL